MILYQYTQFWFLTGGYNALQKKDRNETTLCIAVGVTSQEKHVFVIAKWQERQTIIANRIGCVVPKYVVVYSSNEQNNGGSRNRSKVTEFS